MRLRALDVRIDSEDDPESLPTDPDIIVSTLYSPERARRGVAEDDPTEPSVP